ncbi:hypothetical protein [Streptomyces axinellae]
MSPRHRLRARARYALPAVLLLAAQAALMPLGTAHAQQPVEHTFRMLKQTSGWTKPVSQAAGSAEAV